MLTRDLFAIANLVAVASATCIQRWDNILIVHPSLQQSYCWSLSTLMFCASIWLAGHYLRHGRNIRCKSVSLSGVNYSCRLGLLRRRGREDGVSSLYFMRVKHPRAPLIGCMAGGLQRSVDATDNRNDSRQRWANYTETDNLDSATHNTHPPWPLTSWVKNHSHTWMHRCQG